MPDCRFRRAALLACVLAFACSTVFAQDMRGPPPGGDPHAPRDGRPPPPPDDPFGDRDPHRRPPPPPPPPPPEGSPAPGATAAVDVAQPAPAPVPAVAPAAPAAAQQPAAVVVVQEAAPPPAKDDDHRLSWAPPPPLDLSQHRPRVTPAASTVAAAPAGAIQRVIEARWPWLLAIAFPLVVLLLLRQWGTSRRLAGEAERLSRHQRMLQNVNRNLQGESEHLRHLAINDPLTGTLNRRAFAEDLRALLDHLSRFGRPLDLVVFDLDHFKAINDRQGHLAGDAALRLVAGVVRRHLNSDDLFGRFGGDEFLIGCADRAPGDTATLADAIRRDVVAASLVADPPLPGLSLSVGIARATRDAGYDVDALFHRADTALYAAKRGGRNRVVLADESLPEPPAAESIARQLA